MAVQVTGGCFCFSLFCSILLAVRGSVDVGNMGDLFNTIGGLSEIFGSGEECDFTCPNGVTPQPRSNHKPTSNGCGSYGIKLDTSSLPGMTACCNTHDLCYDSCGTDRKTCDRAFKACLERICDGFKSQSKTQVKDCQNILDLSTGAVKYLGCFAFLKAKHESCSCPVDGATTPDYARELEEFAQLHGPNSK